jgi:predicted nucleic acid-binding protein
MIVVSNTSPIINLAIGINQIGLLGVLVRAKHEGLISAVGPVMDSLMTKAGFWIGEDLYNHVLQVTGESK